MTPSEQTDETAQKSRGRWSVWKTFVIGRQDNPMMKRLRVVQTPWFGVYIHFIYREDMDPVPHDHPWSFRRMVLRGSYCERYLTNPAFGACETRVQRPFRPSRVPTTHAHRIVAVTPGTTSIVLVGRKSRSWGFWGPDEEIEVGPGQRVWVDFRDALGLRPSEGVHSQDVVTPSGQE